MSFWLPIISAIGFGVCLLQAFRWQQRVRLLALQSYRHRYSQLVVYFEHLVLAANEIGAKTSQIEDKKLLKGYQDCLDILEKLLKTMRKIAPFGNSSAPLEPLLKHTNDLRKKMHQIQQDFKILLVRESGLSEEPIERNPTEDDERNCYFCSRPRIGTAAYGFRKAKMQLHGKDRLVWGCKICCDELEVTGKVRVLFFKQGGRPVHWRQIEDYQPTEEYWGLNDSRKKGKITHLEVVRPPDKYPDPK